MEALGSPRKHPEAGEAPGSTKKPLEVMGSTRKHLAVHGREPLGSTGKD